MKRISISVPLVSPFCGARMLVRPLYLALADTGIGMKFSQAPFPSLSFVFLVIFL